MSAPGLDQPQDCAHCGHAIALGAEHYPHPDQCTGDGLAGWSTGTAPVHLDCCPYCNEGVPW